MRLTPHFSVEEFVASQTADRRDIDNSLTSNLLESARNTCNGLEQVRSLLGNLPILISSGYRSLELNRAVGGSKSSQHMLAQAVDFTCPGFGSVAHAIEKIMQSDIQYDQLIREFATIPGRGWVHISFTLLPPRKQVLIIDATGVRAYA
ncbi:MAG: peptidase M15 [Comamonadaceae bacterium CG12_big_fil_rev_8_21_14_0_65_59_15]|nr:MAG: peptidase M15 [Comamonadaceae bacterium CG12_big_fil_rev_8_21_14_0_65_59_15]